MKWARQFAELTLFYAMQLVTPSAVAMADSTLMAVWIANFQNVLFFMVIMFWFHSDRLLISRWFFIVAQIAQMTQIFFWPELFVFFVCDATRMTKNIHKWLINIIREKFVSIRGHFCSAAGKGNSIQRIKNRWRFSFLWFPWFLASLW